VEYLPIPLQKHGKIPRFHGTALSCARVRFPLPISKNVSASFAEESSLTSPHSSAGHPSGFATASRTRAPTLCATWNNACRNHRTNVHGTTRQIVHWQAARSGTVASGTLPWQVARQSVPSCKILDLPGSCPKLLIPLSFGARVQTMSPVSRHNGRVPWSALPSTGIRKLLIPGSCAAKQLSGPGRPTRRRRRPHKLASMRIHAVRTCCGVVITPRWLSQVSDSAGFRRTRAHRVASFPPHGPCFLARAPWLGYP